MQTQKTYFTAKRENISLPEENIEHLHGFVVGKVILLE